MSNGSRAVPAYGGGIQSSVDDSGINCETVELLHLSEPERQQKEVFDHHPHPHHHQHQQDHPHHNDHQHHHHHQESDINSGTGYDIRAPTACRARALSMHAHASSVDRRDKYSRRNTRRKSLPSVERIVPTATDRALIDNFLAVPKVEGNMDDANGDDHHSQSENEPASVRRARSFRERRSRNGEPLRRVRSFKTTSKGLVNRGDSFKAKKNTIHTGSAVNPGEEVGNDVTDEVKVAEEVPKLEIPTPEPVRIEEPSHYFFRVMMIGAAGVGKSSLIDQFMTSDFLGSGDFNISQSEDERSVTVQVDGDESTLEFVRSNDDVEDIAECSSIDGYIVVYSICDRTSFERAGRLLIRLREEIGHHKAIILAANKSDIVRKRVISTEDGREVADRHGCKYIETSAALNLKVDELLVGMLKQILLKMHALGTSSNDVTDITVGKSPLKRRKSSSFKRTKLFLEKLFRGSSGKDKTTENLYV